MAIILAELKDKARQRSDMENSNFVSDAELTTYINDSIAELHDLMIQAYDADYFTQDYEFSTTSNVDTYSLPTDFYKLRGVDVRINNDNWQTVKPYNFNERNRNTDGVVWDLLGLPAIRYRIVGANIKFTPKPTQNADIRMWYTPVATQLVNDTDSLDDLNAYAEYVVVDAAIKMRTKEESDTTEFVRQKAEMRDRILNMAKNRDSGSSATISDVTAENDSLLYWT